MPIQIKKPQFKPCDRTYRRSAAVTMAVTVVFAAALIFLMRIIVGAANMDAEDFPLKVKLSAAGLFAVYILYFVSCVTSLALGVRAYRREDNVRVLAQSAFFLAASVFCLMNLQLALAVVFSAFDLDEAARKVTGAQTYGDFVQGQFASWVCLIAGMVGTLVTGILAVVTLKNNRK